MIKKIKEKRDNTEITYRESKILETYIPFRNYRNKDALVSSKACSDCVGCGGMCAACGI